MELMENELIEINRLEKILLHLSGLDLKGANSKGTDQIGSI